MAEGMPLTKLALLAASLVAVLLLARAVRWFGLGATYQRIRDANHAIELAEEAECGFAGIAADVDAAGYGAIVRNAGGAMMLVRSHGNRFAARRIDAGFAARLDRGQLTLASGERAFGSVTLDFGGEAAVIASRLRTIYPQVVAQ
jgi:hypothetical protein